MDGWPNRAGRLNYTAGGVDMEDERHVTNPKTQLSAAQLKLLWWQAGGAGLLVPKAVFVYRPPPLMEYLMFGAFTWDDEIYVGVPMVSAPAFFSPTYNGVGDFTFTFPNQVLGRPDENGVQQLESLSFVGSKAQAVNTWSGVGAFSAHVSSEILTPQSIRVRVHDVVGAAPANAEVIVRLF